MDRSKLSPEILVDLREKFDEVSCNFFNIYNVQFCHHPGSVVGLHEFCYYYITCHS